MDNVVAASLPTVSLDWVCRRPGIRVALNKHEALNIPKRPTGLVKGPEIRSDPRG